MYDKILTIEIYMLFDNSGIAILQIAEME